MLLAVAALPLTNSINRSDLLHFQNLQPCGKQTKRLLVISLETNTFSWLVEPSSWVRVSGFLEGWVRSSVLINEPGFVRARRSFFFQICSWVQLVFLAKQVRSSGPLKVSESV